MSETKFSTVMPVQFSKAEDGSYKVRGLASTEDRDLQGEIVKLSGLDLTPVDQGRGLLNLDHSSDPRDVVGTLDAYKKTKDGLYIEGTLFKEHDKAKALYQILQSTKGTGKRPVGLSIEGVIKERAGADGSVIKDAVINAVALTFSPVNPKTWMTVAKSLAASDRIQFAGTRLTSEAERTVIAAASPVSFSADQVIALAKALSLDSGYATKLPDQLSGGEAISHEDFKKEPAKATFEEKEEKCMKCNTLHKGECLVKNEDAPDYEVAQEEETKTSPLAKAFSKKIETIMKQLRVLYPDQDEKLLWKVFSARMNAKYPGLGM